MARQIIYTDGKKKENAALIYVLIYLFANVRYYPSHCQRLNITIFIIHNSAFKPFGEEMQDMFISGIGSCIKELAHV